jgi:ATP-binding protein involved in chromosome partitioning
MWSINSLETQLPGQRLRDVKNVIAIGSGKGGVGKSTVTVGLAFALAKLGFRVGILDADIYGPSIPLLVGCHGKTLEFQENTGYEPIVVDNVQTMSIGYLAAYNQALVWRGPMVAKALLQLFNHTRWDNLDFLLVDLPPGTGDIQLSLVQKIPLAGAIVVSTPHELATLDAAKAVTMFQKTGITLLGLVENMSHYTCENCQHSNHVFGTGAVDKLAIETNLPILAKLPYQMASLDCIKLAQSLLESFVVS